MKKNKTSLKTAAAAVILSTAIVAPTMAQVALSPAQTISANKIAELSQDLPKTVRVLKGIRIAGVLYSAAQLQAMSREQLASLFSANLRHIEAEYEEVEIEYADASRATLNLLNIIQTYNIPERPYDVARRDISSLLNSMNSFSSFSSFNSFESGSEGRDSFPTSSMG